MDLSKGLCHLCHLFVNHFFFFFLCVILHWTNGKSTNPLNVAKVKGWKAKGLRGEKGKGSKDRKVNQEEQELTEKEE